MGCLNKCGPIRVVITSIISIYDGAPMSSSKFGIPRQWFLLVAIIGVGVSVPILVFIPQAGSYLALHASSPTKSDLVVILGGGWKDRVNKGKWLLRRGYAKHVLLTGMKLKRNGSGVRFDSRYYQLLAAGINADMIFTDSSAKNTWQEAHVISALLHANGWRSVIVVTDPPHLRRLTWVCKHVLSGANIKYTLVPTMPQWWDADHWWRNTKSRWFVIWEYIKLIGYRLLYS